MSAWDELSPWTMRVYVAAVVVIALALVTIALLLYDALIYAQDLIELLESLDSALEGEL